MRGIPGSGKSTLARTIEDLARRDYGFNMTLICSADDFRIKNGKYFYDPKETGKVHKNCQLKFKQALAAAKVSMQVNPKDNKSLIIVDNTNVNLKDFKFYIDLAKSDEYHAQIMIVRPSHKNALNVDYCYKNNVHNVPRETIQKFLDDFKRNLVFSADKLFG